ncbi:MULTISPECIES: hypothetical protein [unclassified Leifsonia]|uniref:hypothetical protein n=1 Tax=unclassified Leifsonia TaxID=2663824 RepID=UPI000A19779B|nr:MULTISPECIES: hypothetical protein [unclassified Leifsonia]QIZ97200.1 hypothetical protein HF024_00655 [Leifsonia sp. PS1209]
MDAQLEPWAEFNVAIAGAGAALGGLLIVALSVNIKQIAESRGLAARAGAAVAALILGIVLACVALIPGQALWGYGIVTLVGTAIGVVIAVMASRAIVHDPGGAEYHRYDVQHIVSFVLPLVIFAVGGVLGVLSLPAALYLVAIGTIVALLGAALFSWIALVEILR